MSISPVLKSKYDAYMLPLSSTSSPATSTRSSADTNPSSPIERMSAIQKEGFSSEPTTTSEKIIVRAKKKRASSFAGVDTKIKHLLRRSANSGGSTPSTVSPPSSLSCSPSSANSTKRNSDENEDFTDDNLVTVKIHPESKCLSSSAPSTRPQKKIAPISKKEPHVQTKKKRSGSFVVIDAKIKTLLQRKPNSGTSVISQEPTSPIKKVLFEKIPEYIPRPSVENLEGKVNQTAKCLSSSSPAIWRIRPQTKAVSLSKKESSFPQILEANKKKEPREKTKSLIIPEIPSKTINEIFSEIQKKSNQMELNKGLGEQTRGLHVFNFDIPIAKILKSIINNYHARIENYNEDEDSAEKEDSSEKEFVTIYDFVTFRAIANIFLNRFLEKRPYMKQEPYLSNLIFISLCIAIKSGSDCFSITNRDILDDFDLIKKEENRMDAIKIKDFSYRSMRQMEVEFLFTIEFNLIQIKDEIENERTNILKKIFTSVIPVKNFLQKINAKVDANHEKSLLKKQKFAWTREYGNILSAANVKSEIEWTREHSNILRLATMFLEIFTNKNPLLKKDEYLPSLKMTALRRAARTLHFQPVIKWTNRMFKAESFEDQENLIFTMDHVFFAEMLTENPCKGSNEWLKDVLLAKPLT